MQRLAILQGLRATHYIRPHSLPLRTLSTLQRPSPQYSLQLRKPLALALATFQQKRNTASSVSGRPASESIPHAIQNAREEAKGIASDVAKIIAAANFDKRKHEWDGFSDITSTFAAQVPKPILITGLAGALPYVGATASTLLAARTAGLLAAGHAARFDYDTAITVLEAASQVQVTYGAVLLSFLGALHWGMEFAGYGGHKGYRRLALGVAPVVFGWSTLLLTPSMGLVSQWIGFSAMWYADMKVTELGWTPIWYSQYRFYLSILIGSCMIATLFFENYLNPVIETTTYTINPEDTNLPASSNTAAHVEAGGKFAGTSDKIGDIETVEGETYFVILKHKGGAEGEESDEESAKEHVDAASEDNQEKMEEIQQSGKAGGIKKGTSSNESQLE